MKCKCLNLYVYFILYSYDFLFKLMFWCWWVILVYILHTSLLFLVQIYCPDFLTSFFPLPSLVTLCLYIYRVWISSYDVRTVKYIKQLFRRFRRGTRTCTLYQLWHPVTKTILTLIVLSNIAVLSQSCHIWIQWRFDIFTVIFFKYMYRGKEK